MASRWEDLADELNEIFKEPTSLKKFSTKFKELHGNNGEKYRFGVHATHGDVKNKNDKQLMKDAQKGQFMIDSGTTHWDSSLTTIEDKIKHHIVNELPLKFTVILSDDPHVILATGRYNPTPNPPEITITCPRTPGSIPKTHP